MINIADVAVPGIEGVTTYILKETAKGVYGAVSEGLVNKIKEAFAKKQLEIIRENTNRLSKIKTILHPDKIVDLDLVYYPGAINFEGQQLDEISDFPESQILIEGGPGQGKSLFLRHLCVTESRGNRFVPIYIEFRSLDYDLSFTDALFSSIRDFGLDLEKGTFDFLAKSKMLLLIFDGFDEIPSAHKNRLAKEMDALAKKYPKLNIVISSRPSSGINNSFYYQRYKIDKLTEDKQIAFVEFIFSDQPICIEVVTLLEESAFIAEVTTSPLLLTLFLITYHARQFEPDSITEFYKLIFPTMLYRHDRMKLGFARERSSKLTDFQMEKVFESLSFISLKENNTRFAKRRFLQYLELSIQAEDLHKNIEEKILSDIVDITSLIVEDGFEEYSYVHKSIQEYFAAIFIKESSLEDKKSFYTHARQSIDNYRKWQNVVDYLSIIDKYSHNRYFSIPYQRKALGIISISKVKLSVSLFKTIISDETNVLITENGEIESLYWGDTILSSLNPEYASQLRAQIKSSLKNYRGTFAEFFEFCDLADYEMYQIDSKSFLVPLLFILNKHDLIEPLRENIESQLVGSRYIRDLFAEENSLLSAEEHKRQLMQF